MAHRNDKPGGLPGFFQQFVHSEVSGSIVLLGATVVALVWANSPVADSYFDLVKTYIGVAWGDASFKMSLQHWVNDLLMVLFFFVVGLEIKREILVGELASARKAALPVAAAVGGMVVPAGLYAMLNVGGPGASGWGIPMATDIAFALGILALLGKRVPLGLKVFLTALAIADDLGAVLVIAVFYSASINVTALVAAAVLLVAIVVAGRFGMKQVSIYLLLGFGVWVAVLASGVHATVAGVLVALTIPVRARRDPGAFWEVAERALAKLRGREMTRESMIDDQEQLAALESLHDAAGDMVPPGLALEHRLHPVLAFLVLPLFALVNAGVAIGGGPVAAPVSITTGIILGLVVGKPLGIVVLSWLTVKLGRGELPAGVSWGQILGAGLLAGVGFTMALFIGDLAFVDAAATDRAKIGILVASAVAGVAGYVVLLMSTRRSARG
jgi:NhaA family Na+:H+ antiporter